MSNPHTSGNVNLPDENEARRRCRSGALASVPNSESTSPTGDRVTAGETNWLPQPLNSEWHAVLRKRLRGNPEAMRRLLQLGLSEATVERFGLGLSKPRPRRGSEMPVGDALVYPMTGPDGSFYKAYGYRNLPGITKNPRHRNSWLRGFPVTYYSGPSEPHDSVIVCQRILDVWLICQALNQGIPEDEFLAIASSHEKVFPGEWYTPNFWSRWTIVYLVFDADEEGEHLSGRLTESLSGDVRQVRPPSSCDNRWSNFWRNGVSAARFRTLLEEGLPPTPQLKTEEESPGGLGRFAYEPIDINGAFKDGHLYCTVQTLNREMASARGKLGHNEFEVVERLETVVVRSDRTVHTASVMKAPPGTKYFDRVLRLSDGTLIDREPRPNKYATWSWQSIRAYLEDRSRVRPLADILRNVIDYLKRSVLLPFEEDYALLTLTVPVTYTQTVFDSVPLLFLNGPPGSGKSEAGRAMARLCANASVCGQSSAASISRLIDESRGFVVLDDLEAIGSRGGEFSELVQALKQSYNKETAVKLWTDVKTMRTERLNFFGVKMGTTRRASTPSSAAACSEFKLARYPNRLDSHSKKPAYARTTIWKP